MKKLTFLALALSLCVAGAESTNLVEDSDNPQYSALLSKLKLGTCEADTYGATLDASDEFMAYDLDYTENLSAHKESLALMKSMMEEGGSKFKLVKTVNDSPISFIDIVEVDGDKMADRYVYLSGYEFNEWCWLK